MEIPRIQPDELPKVPFVINGISSRFIREHKIILIELKDNVLKVGMADPEDSATIDALSVATSSDIPSISNITLPGWTTASR